MTRSTDTSQRQPYRAARRATAASIGSGPQAWSSTSAPAGRRGQRAFERNGHAAALAARPVLGAQHQRDAELLEVVQIEQVGVAAPAVEERELHAAARPTSRRRSRTAPGPRRRRPSRPRWRASGSVKARPRGPRHCTRCPASAVEDLRGRHADALAENRDAHRRGCRRAESRTPKTAGAAADRCCDRASPSRTGRARWRRAMSGASRLSTL